METHTGRSGSTTERKSIMEQIAICGTGRIAAGIATLLTGNSLPVLIFGRSEQSLERFRGTVAVNWDDLIREGLAKEENKRAAMALPSFTTGPALLADRTFVFEAVAEELGVKGQVYAQIESSTKEGTVIASTTSSISADLLQSVSSRPEYLLIAHPFQPAHMLPLFEVVQGEKTCEDAAMRTVNLLESVDREVVRLKKCLPGFLVNRFAQALFRESLYLIEQGVTTAEEIDRAIKYAMGMRYASIGLLEYFDDVGFSLEKQIAENIYPDLHSTPEIQDIVLSGLASGQTGLAAGKGLYDWSGKDLDDYRRRKQSPYFERVKNWNMPE